MQLPALYTGKTVLFGLIFVVCFPYFLQLTDKLVEQIFHCFLASSSAKPRKGAVIRRFLILQQLSEVDTAWQASSNFRLE